MSNLNHLAIIMDGNARWASFNGMLPMDGHRKGAENAFNIIEAAIKQNVKNLSLFAFSSENWDRPADEVNNLLNLLSEFANNESDKIRKLGIKIKFVGELSLLDKKILSSLEWIEKFSSNFDKINLYVMISYGGRAEIIKACKTIISHKVKENEINNETFSKFFYAPELPDVDLLIRTGDKYRISNFLLWHCAYAEFYFSKKMWPDFNAKDLRNAIKDYEKRNRSFGQRSEK